MERKIGEVFEFEGKKLKVEKATLGYCDGCYLSDGNCIKYRNTTGECVNNYRSDETDVIFKDITNNKEEL